MGDPLFLHFLIQRSFVFNEIIIWKEWETWDGQTIKDRVVCAALSVEDELRMACS